MSRRKNYIYDEETNHDLTGEAGEVVCEIDAPGSPHVSCQIDGDGDTADYAVDVSAKGDT